MYTCSLWLQLWLTDIEFFSRWCPLSKLKCWTPPNVSMFVRGSWQTALFLFKSYWVGVPWEEITHLYSVTGWKLSEDVLSYSIIAAMVAYTCCIVEDWTEAQIHQRLFDLKDQPWNIYVWINLLDFSVWAISNYSHQFESTSINYSQDALPAKFESRRPAAPPVSPGTSALAAGAGHLGRAQLVQLVSHHVNGFPEGGSWAALVPRVKVCGVGSAPLSQSLRILGIASSATYSSYSLPYSCPALASFRSLRRRSTTGHTPPSPIPLLSSSLARCPSTWQLSGGDRPRQLPSRTSSAPATSRNSLDPPPIDWDRS
jgi:hypothetical protein